MMLQAALPPDIERRLAARLDGEPVRYSLASDLTLERQFGASYVVVTDKHVAVCDADTEPRTLPLSELKEVKLDELFGSGRMVAVVDGVEAPLIYYTKVIVPEFAVMTRAINALIRGRKPELPDEEEASHCPRCGAPLPERGEMCPRCISRATILSRLMTVLRPYALQATLVVVLATCASLTQMVPPMLIQTLTDSVIGDSRLDLLLPVILAMLGVYLGFLVLRLSVGMLSAWLSMHVVADLRDRLHGHIQRLRLDYFNRRDSGQLVARVAHDTQELQHFLTDGLPYLVVYTLLFTFISGYMLVQDWRLAILVFIPVPFLMGGARRFWRKLITIYHKYSTHRGELHSILGESIHGIRSVKAYSQEGSRTTRFDHTSDRLRHTGFMLERTWIGFSETLQLIMSVGVVGIWYFGARRVVSGADDLTLGELLKFTGLAALFYQPLRMYMFIVNWMTHAMASLERIFGVLDAPPETYDAPDAVPMPDIKGHIELSDVHFSYERGKEVIKGITLDIQPGEMIGLVGKSGAGKSTIINLICRFYEVDSGQIRIDGVPMDKVKLTDLRAQIGMVMQEPFLFNASILDNIRAGCPDASFEDVVRAARAAHAHGFILDKEEGYDTVVGEGGASLSGGEKQRIAIARAILHDPPILILDEATSSVDTETESKIQEAITRLVKNRTTIAIAHRLGTLRHADRLVVVDDGRIIEMGSHDELLASGGTYAKLVEKQTQLNQMKSEIWSE